MTIQIIKNEKDIEVLLNKEKDGNLLIYDGSDKWNKKEINNFLLKIIRFLDTNNNETINIEKNEQHYKEDVLYKHICDLFINFAEGFNNEILKENN